VRTLTEIAPGVFVTSSRRDRTNSTVIRRGDRVVLVDPAWDPDELAALATSIQHAGWHVTAGVATHAHHDHVLWHPDLPDVPRYASPQTVDLARERRAELLSALDSWPAELVGLVGRLQPARGAVEEPFGDDGPAEPIQLVAHDGHCPGHCAVWLGDRAVLLAGDMLSDVELPLPHDPDDLPAYLAGLEVLAPYVRQAAVLVPGHGTPCERPLDRLDADRRYLTALLAGREVEDERLANPGMAEVHARNVAIAHRSHL
jgi:glyoxylase-like metal-dependent hydrolase (beta-lactamase superfamily II)